MTLEQKIKQALRYKSASFSLIEGDNKTKLTRNDLYQILKMLSEPAKSPYEGYGIPKNGW